MSKNISTGGGDYAEGNIDKRQVTFITIRKIFTAQQQDVITELPHEQRRTIVLIILTTIISLLTAIVTNIVTEISWQADPFIFSIALIGMILCAIATIVLTIWQSRQRRTQITAIDIEILRKTTLNWASAEIEYRLASALPHPALPLYYAKEPSLINRPATPNEKSKKLPTKQLMDLTNDQPIGLLIAGAPGSGKTVVLIELAQVMCREAQADEKKLIPADEKKPVPVIFDLETWRTGYDSLGDWLAQQLKMTCPISYENAHRLIHTRQVRPLLDGLDKVAPDNRPGCVAAINDFVQRVSPDVIITARSDMIREGIRERTLAPLAVSHAVSIQPLCWQDILHAINNYGRDDDRTKWRRSKFEPVVTQIRANAAIQEFARTPLMLHLLLRTAESSGTETTPLESSKLYRYVVERYLTYLLTPAAPYTLETIDTGLRWIAKNLIRDSTKVLKIESIQPHWLQTKRARFFYTLSVSLVAGGVFAFISLFGRWFAVTIAAGLLLSNRRDSVKAPRSGLTRLMLVLIVVLAINGLLVPVAAAAMGVARCSGGFVFCWDVAVTFGLFGGLVCGLIASPSWSQPRIQPIGRLWWSWPDAKAGLVVGFGLGLTITLPLVLGLWVVFGSPLAPQDMMIGALGFAFAIGLVLAVILCLVRGITVESWSSPPAIANEGVIRSLGYAAFTGIIVGPGTWLLLQTVYNSALIIETLPAWSRFAAPLVGMLNMLLTNMLLLNPGVPFSFGLALAFGLGGFVAIQHYLLRLQLKLQRLLPWNCPRFLNNLEGRQVLRREGGTYTFMPEWLREYLGT